MTVDEFITALINIEVEIEATRERRTAIIVSNALDAATSRVINTGMNYEGRPFPPYSTKNVSPWAFFTHPGEKKNTTKTDQVATILDFIKKYGKDTNYANWRHHHGLPVEYKNFTFTEEMWKSLKVDVIKTGPRETEWGVTSGDQVNLEVLLKHQDKHNIMFLNDDELDLVHAANQDRIASIIENEFDKYD